MTFGTGPQALVSYIKNNWQASRSGREDVPDVTTSPDTEFGIVVTNDRKQVVEQYSVHDLIHCYHPQATGIDIEDAGFDEKNTIETVQIDIDATDRTDPNTGERLNASTRLVGDRTDPNFPSDESAPYPGIFGETMYVLEEIRRDFEEWDVVRMQPVNIFLGNSNANISLDVQLEHVATNTVV